MAKTNYFQMMIKRYGENWIVASKPEDIQRAGKNIVKEMVKGDINYQIEGNYFLDPKFLDNLLIHVENELQTNVLYYNAVAFYKNAYPLYPNITIELNHLNAVCIIYTNILNKLKMVKSTGNIGYLADTSSILYTYRNHLN